MIGQHQEGMTILEVVLAITILMIGAGFLVKSNAVSTQQMAQQELQQQMVFFAAGQMEAVLEGQTQNFTSETPKLVASEVYAPGDTKLEFDLDGTTIDLNGLLTPFGVSVASPSLAKVEMYNYRIQLP